jgi:hypothetical protein
VTRAWDDSITARRPERHDPAPNAAFSLIAVAVRGH